MDEENAKKELAAFKELYHLSKPLIEYHEKHLTIDDAIVITANAVKIVRASRIVPIDFAQNHF